MNERASAIKDYICTHFCEETQETERACDCGLKKIWVPQNVARTLYLIAKMIRPKRILEIGTFAGYSALWLAKALEEEGRLITIEADKERYQKALETISLAQNRDQIQLLNGDAIPLLGKMVEDRVEPFDLVFIDADKAEYPDYLEPVIQLTRSGGVILTDNVIPKRGGVGVPVETDTEAVEVYLFNQMLSQDPRLEAHILPTIVGSEGRIDGLAIALVK